MLRRRMDEWQVLRCVDKTEMKRKVIHIWMFIIFLGFSLPRPRLSPSNTVLSIPISLPSRLFLTCVTFQFYKRQAVITKIKQ